MESLCARHITKLDCTSKNTRYTWMTWIKISKIFVSNDGIEAGSEHGY